MTELGLITVLCSAIRHLWNSVSTHSGATSPDVIF